MSCGESIFRSLFSPFFFFVSLTPFSRKANSLASSRRINAYYPPLLVPSDAGFHRNNVCGADRNHIV